MYLYLVIPCVSEPFERNNVARAVHQKAKFEAIRAQFAEVQDCTHNSNILFLSASVGQIWVGSNPSRLSVTSQSFHILKRWRDLNSILPVRDIINTESSMRWGMSVIGRVDRIFYLKTGLSPGLQRPLGSVGSWGVLPLCSSLEQDRTMWHDTTARLSFEDFCVLTLCI